MASTYKRKDAVHVAEEWVRRVEDASVSSFVSQNSHLYLNLRRSECSPFAREVTNSRILSFAGCARTYESSLHVERVNATKSDKLLSTNTYLLSIIITAVLLVSLIIGMLCFWKYLRIHNEGINVYVDPQQDDSACLKSVNFDNVVDNGASEKRTDRNNLAYDDIVLLYTESSTSFMALMKNFRETLSKTCSCFVSLYTLLNYPAT